MQVRNKRNPPKRNPPSTVLIDGIVAAVATLDQADGSRVSLIESIDNARRTLSEVMPDNFEDLVAEYLEVEDDDDEDDDDEEYEFEDQN